jgi:hypothetical protein
MIACPDYSIQAGNLSYIVEVSLFKMEHSQVPPTCGVIPLFHRQLRVSYLMQIPNAIGLKVNRLPGASSSQDPQTPVHCVHAYKTPAGGNGWGLANNRKLRITSDC